MSVILAIPPVNPGFLTPFHSRLTTMTDPMEYAEEVELSFLGDFAGEVAFVTPEFGELLASLAIFWVEMSRF